MGQDRRMSRCNEPFAFSNSPASLNPAFASKGSAVSTTDAVIVSGRSSSGFSSSGIGASLSVRGAEDGREVDMSIIFDVDFWRNLWGFERLWEGVVVRRWWRNVGAELKLTWWNSRRWMAREAEVCPAAAEMARRQMSSSSLKTRQITTLELGTDQKSFRIQRIQCSTYVQFRCYTYSTSVAQCLDIYNLLYSLRRQNYICVILNANAVFYSYS
jgi:hypothetical protein